ncbi:uncharacterized protein LOC143238149 [Tachypleus tridentatus]|uniref:uncharacterized protein LOC143238149 n=1 Tax=Tachypleus tridentatus TaxID=6853 RepID=UPI003FD3B3A2
MKMRKFPTSFFNEPSQHFSSNSLLSVSSLSCQCCEVSKIAPPIHQNCEFDSYHSYLSQEEKNYKFTNDITICDFDQMPLVDLNSYDLKTNSLPQKEIEPVSILNGNFGLYELNTSMEDLLSSQSWKEVMSNQGFTKTESKNVFNFNFASNEMSSDPDVSQQDITNIWSERNKYQCDLLNSGAPDLTSYSPILSSSTSDIQGRQETKYVSHNSDHSLEESFFEIFEDHKLSNNLCNTSNKSLVNGKHLHLLEDQVLSENLLMDLPLSEHTLVTNNSLCYSTGRSDSTMNTSSVLTHKAHFTNDFTIGSNYQDFYQDHISTVLIYPEDNGVNYHSSM